jgi:hypothetical protein
MGPQVFRYENSRATPQHRRGRPIFPTPHLAEVPDDLGRKESAAVAVGRWTRRLRRSTPGIGRVALF